MRFLFISILIGLVGLATYILNLNIAINTCEHMLDNMRNDVTFLVSENELLTEKIVNFRSKQLNLN